jgi:HSP20 family protein
MPSPDEGRKRPRYWFSKVFDDMEERFDEMFGAFFDASSLDKPSWDIDGQCLTPLSQVTETEDKVIVTVDLPHVSKENIKLHSTEKTLEVEAKTNQGICFEKWGTVQKCTEFNCFRKKIKLPAEVKPNEAKATFKSGILEIQIVKRFEKTPIKIE